MTVDRVMPAIGLARFSPSFDRRVGLPRFVRASERRVIVFVLVIMGPVLEFTERAARMVM